MSPPPAAAVARIADMTEHHILAELLDSMGRLLHDMGSVKARLDHGQGQFETIRKEQESIKTTITTVLSPLVTKVETWEEHVEAAKTTTKKFADMEPEFGKMKTVTARFMVVAMTSGMIVGAALWALGTIGPYVWGLISKHINWS